MGQQQLLLLVLGIVIVGLAVVAGIQAFAENQKKANADALLNDGIRVASAAQAWYLKPAAFGGPEDGESLADARLKRIGLATSPSGSFYKTTNGTFYRYGGSSAGTHGCFSYMGQMVNNGEVSNRIFVQVSGPSLEDIKTGINVSGADLLNVTCTIF